MDDIERELIEKARRVRPHAGFFDWPVKETKELGVVRTLIDQTDANASLRLLDVRPGRPDPPDAIGTRNDGAPVAVEVTELVDQDVTAHNVRVMRQSVGEDFIERGKKLEHRVWDAAGLIAAVQALLRDKDGKTLNGGPFAQYVVVIHTDEMMLTHVDAAEWLRGHLFPDMRQITDAYILFSYDGSGYPHIRLNVGR